MFTDLQITRVTYEEKSVLGNLLEICQHDYSEFDGEDVDEHGRYGYKYLDHYWTEPGRHPFIVRVDGKIAGFALVRDSINTGDCHHIAEFFIMRKYRRTGIGRTVAHRVFDMFPGAWRVNQTEGNHPAQAFWRKIIGEYTGGRFEEIRIPSWDGPTQEFESRTDPR